MHFSAVDSWIGEESMPAAAGTRREGDEGWKEVLLRSAEPPVQSALELSQLLMDKESAHRLPLSSSELRRSAADQPHR